MAMAGGRSILDRMIDIIIVIIMLLIVAAILYPFLALPTIWWKWKGLNSPNETE